MGVLGLSLRPGKNYLGIALSNYPVSAFEDQEAVRLDTYPKKCINPLGYGDRLRARRLVIRLLHCLPSPVLSGRRRVNSSSIQTNNRGIHCCCVVWDHMGQFAAPRAYPVPSLSGTSVTLCSQSGIDFRGWLAACDIYSPVDPRSASFASLNTAAISLLERVL